MHPFEVFIAAVISSVLAFQVWLTHRVFKSVLYERKQKIMQAQLIWLLPILGAGLVFSVLQDDAKAERDASSQLKS